MLTPALALVALVAIYPLGATIYAELHEPAVPRRDRADRSSSGCRTTATSSTTRSSGTRSSSTVKFTVITVSFELVLGLIIALVVNSGFKGRGVMRAVMLVPWAIPTVVAAQMWKWMYDDVFGVINDAGSSGCTSSTSPSRGSPSRARRSRSVAAVDIWKTTPFVALLLLAGLQVIPHELYEAADVDGASKWQQFWRITLPAARARDPRRAHLPHARRAARLRRLLRVLRLSRSTRRRWRSTTRTRSSRRATSATARR